MWRIVTMTRNISIWKQLEIDNSDRKIHKHALYFYNIGNTDFIHFLYNTMNDTIQFIMFAVYRLHLWKKCNILSVIKLSTIINLLLLIWNEKENYLKHFILTRNKRQVLILTNNISMKYFLFKYLLWAWNHKIYWKTINILSKYENILTKYGS